jgi:hypothetical protein
MQSIADVIVHEGNWLPFSMTVALLSIAFAFYRYRHAERSTRNRITFAMNLFFGATIAVMAFGHLLAVSVKFASGTLRGSVLVLYLFGIMLSVPAWSLMIHARRFLSTVSPSARNTVLLNSWMAITLLVLGIHNLPIAAPAIFNIGYALHSHRAVGWAILSVAVVLHLGLFIGALMFLLSGQTFEEFSGIQ